ncbi:hypothetical protein M747DRAFT_29783 [Aspergillus niger ATCC 13496]|uniref:Uncharacterized protein n=1 Tax=Aspergillus niger ATCC 13496 TaxID=1353008 RepID=A0A370C3D1_ASPNG|nr:hypothetical protein M747DRAFT_29783 [Aspergillus niger ATCC 13496]
MRFGVLYILSPSVHSEFPFIFQDSLIYIPSISYCQLQLSFKFLVLSSAYPEKQKESWQSTSFSFSKTTFTIWTPYILWCTHSRRSWSTSLLK